MWRGGDEETKRNKLKLKERDRVKVWREGDEERKRNKLKLK